MLFFISREALFFLACLLTGNRFVENVWRTLISSSIEGVFPIGVLLLYKTTQRASSTRKAYTVEAGPTSNSVTSTGRTGQFAPQSGRAISAVVA